MGNGLGGCAAIDPRRESALLPRLLRACAASATMSRDEARDDARDRDAIRRCLGGDPEAFTEIVARRQAMVARILWRFARDPETHRELVQEAFVEAYAGLRRFRGNAPFAHWLARLATHVGYGYWRKQRRSRTCEVTTEELEAIPDAPSDDPEEQAAAGAMLHRLLETLPPRDRLVLTLRYVEGLSVEETAERTGWSASMVKVQSLRGRAKLRAAFEGASKGGIS